MILNLDRSGLRKCSILQPPRFQGFVNMLLLFLFFFNLFVFVFVSLLSLQLIYAFTPVIPECDCQEIPVVEIVLRSRNTVPPHLLLICFQQFRSNVLPPTWRSCWAPDQKRSDCRCGSRRKSGVHTEDSPLQTARLSDAVLSLCCHPQPLCLLYFGKVKNIFLEWNLDFMQIVDIFFFL